MVKKWSDYSNRTLHQIEYFNCNNNDSGDYSCEISGSCGASVSGNMKLTVYPVTKITFISPNVEVPFGNDVTLQVNADGHDLVYQWQKMVR